MKGPLRFTVGDCFLSIIVLQFDPQSPVSPFHYLSLTWKATPHSIKHTPLVNTHFHPGTQILSLMFTFSYFPSLPIFLTPFHYYHPLSIFSLSLSFIFTILSLSLSYLQSSLYLSASPTNKVHFLSHSQSYLSLWRTNLFPVLEHMHTLKLEWGFALSLFLSYS